MTTSIVITTNDCTSMNVTCKCWSACSDVIYDLSEGDPGNNEPISNIMI